MSDPFVAEIRIFPYNFAPKGWAWCNGQILPISQNTALFSLLGTTYGGDGKSTFALPDMQGNAPMHPGQGQGLSQRFLGEMSGSDNVTLLQTEMPAHTHAMQTSNDDPNNIQPGTRYTGRTTIYGPVANAGLMALQAIGISGGSLPHNNMQPFLTLNFNIALQGVFPARP